MLKNVQEAKFKIVLLPISKVALAPADQAHVVFDAFFTHILMHELMHGLGPHNIRVGGRDTTVRQELKDTYSAIEEAKADASGLWALQYLVDKGSLPKTMQQTMYTTFLASAFRSIRFGVERGARAGDRDPAERAARRRRIPRGGRRHVQRRPGQDPRRRHCADARPDDAARRRGTTRRRRG